MRNITINLNALSESLVWNRSYRIKYLLGLILCVTGIGLTVTAAPSDLDPTFGSGGKVVSVPGDLQQVSASDMALQADGKIILVGGDGSAPGNVGFVIARYNVNGSLDTGFGNSGWLYITFGASQENANSVAVQPDGKIIVGGYVDGQAGIVRLNPNGSLDATFDGDGRAIIPFTNGQGGNIAIYLYILRIANDGKIVFAGSTPIFNNNYQPIIGRLNPDGSPDSTFSGDGRLVDGGGQWEDLVIQPDGSIYLAGSDSQQFATYMRAAKYNNDGTQAWTYSRGQDFQSMAFNGIAIQPDGKVVLVGRLQGRIIAIRLNPDGSVDNTFSQTTVTADGQAVSVAIQPDGKIIANVAFGSNSDGFSLIRYNTDGTLDSGFGTGGFATTRITDGAERGQKLILQSDGKILVGGSVGFQSYRFAMVRYRGSSAVPGKTLFDYDGDGKADISVFRPSENKWYVLRSSDQGYTDKVFAASGDIPAPADYDGDGRTDVAIFRPSNGAWWYLSSINNAQVNVNWGQAGDIIIPSDFDGDSKTDFVVYRPSNSLWYRLSATGQTSIMAFGIAEDKPLVGDFDGDGKGDLAVFRPSTGDWWYASSISGQFISVHWGATGDIPVPGDYDGDGKTDFVVFRPSDGGWYILYSTGSYTIATFGTVGDKPIAADYDGDGKADIAVFRPSTGIWYLLQTTSGFGAVQWGVSTDIPTENAFIP